MAEFGSGEHCGDCLLPAARKSGAAGRLTAAGNKKRSIVIGYFLCATGCASANVNQTSSTWGSNELLAVIIAIFIYRPPVRHSIDSPVQTLYDPRFAESETSRTG